MKTKHCPRCNLDKNISEFSKDKNRPDGYRWMCKLCRKKENIIYRENHIKYYQKHKDKICLNRKKYYQIHKEKELANNKKYALLNKEKIKKIKKQYKILNSDKVKQADKLYKSVHKEQRNNRDRIRRKYDIAFKMEIYIRNRIRRALKGHKKPHGIKLLGCSVLFLEDYLKKQFTKGMTWKNYGKWHIDHIKPCCLFDLSKASEQLKFFHYSNLQPLWARDNLKKGAKYEKAI